jgi:hypothetical protein
MRIISTNFSKDKDGKQLVTVRLSMGAIDQYSIDNIDGFAERLSQILPGITFNGVKGKNGPGNGAGLAEIVVRAALALQASAGLPFCSWKVDGTGISGNYDITFDCSDESMGDYVARAAFRIVRAALFRQRYSLTPDLNMLRMMSGLSAQSIGRKNTAPVSLAG